MATRTLETCVTHPGSINSITHVPSSDPQCNSSPRWIHTHKAQMDPYPQRRRFQTKHLLRLLECHQMFHRSLYQPRNRMHIRAHHLDGDRPTNGPSQMSAGPLSTPIESPSKQGTASPSSISVLSVSPADVPTGMTGSRLRRPVSHPPSL